MCTPTNWAASASACTGKASWPTAPTTAAPSADPNDEVAIEDAVRRRARLDLFPAHIAKLEHNLKPLLTETYAELEHFRHAYETELAREREALLDEIEKLTKRYSPDREERNGEIINVARNLAAQHGIFAVLRNQFERADGYASATSPAFTLAEAASANLRLHDEWKRGGQSFVPPDFFAAR